MIFCCRTSYPHLLRPPRMLSKRDPRMTPATLLGWTLPFCGTVLPTGCPSRDPDRLPQPVLRRPGRPCLLPRLRLPRLLVRRPPLLHRLLQTRSSNPAAARGLCSSTLVGLVHRRLRRRSRLPPLFLSSRVRRCYRHQLLLLGRLAPARAPCRRPSSATARGDTDLGLSAARQLLRCAGRSKLARGDGRRIQGAHG